MGRAVRELGAEGFDEGFAPADAHLVDEEPGAVFGGAVWGAEIGWGGGGEGGWLVFHFGRRGVRGGFFGFLGWVSGDRV